MPLSLALKGGDPSKPPRWSLSLGVFRDGDIGELEPEDPKGGQFDAVSVVRSTVELEVLGFPPTESMLSLHGAQGG